MSWTRTRMPLWVAAALTTIMGWTLIGLMGAARTFTGLQSAGECPSLREYFWPHMLSVWLWVLFTPLVFKVSNRWRLESASWQRAVPMHLAVGIGLAVLDVLVDLITRPLLLGFDRSPFLVLFGYEFFINMFSYAALVAIAHAISYYRMFRSQEIRSIRLESKLAEARIQALRSHLHPHFLFNTINAAAELVHDDAEAADRMLTRLGQLLQRAFSEAQLVQVPLERELSFARQYLDIAAIRFGERLESTIAASPDAERALVPSFLLQPMVENAIHHGVERASKRVHVEIRASVENGRLHLTVSDTGPGLPGEAAELEWRTGMQKVEGLLRELHAGDHSLELMNRPGGGAIAEVTIPFVPLEDSGAYRTASVTPQTSA